MADVREAPQRRRAPGEAERQPKLTQREQAAIDFACQTLGITRAEFVYNATRQALDEFYADGP